MAPIKRRSSASAAVSKSAIAQASVMLQALPAKPKDNWSLREAVSLLHDSIIAAIDRGYSYEEVAAMLGEKGVEITTPSLKRYLASVKREKEATPKASRGGRRSKSASFESTTLAKVPAKSREKTAEPAPQTKTAAPSKPASRTKAAAPSKPTSRTGGRSRK